jgi:hypothetical protein
MLLTRPFVASDALKRKRPTGSPDIRAPEDRMVARDDGEEHAPISSPEIEKAIVNWVTARRHGDEEELKRAGREVVDATAGYYRAGGMPLFAHHPLPPQLVEAEVRAAQGGVTADTLRRFVGLFDGPVQRAVRQQAAGLLQRPRPLSGERTEAQMSDEHGAGEQSGLFAPMAYNGPASASSEGVMRPSVRSRRDERTEQQIADDLDARDSWAAAAHPLAYGLDAALNDLAGEDGVLGDWGKRRVVPKPSGEAAGAAGEAIRAYLEFGAPLGGVSRAVGATGRALESVASSGVGRALTRVLETRSGKAVAGGLLSTVAEWRVNMDKPPDQQPTGWDYGIAFLSGAVTGGAEPPWGKAELDAGVAFGAALLSDKGSGRPMSVEGALAAGMAAWLVTRAGGIAKFKEARLLSQVGAKYGKKYLEKEVKKYFTAMFGEDIEMAGQRWAKFWNAFQDHMRRQWQEYIERDDRDPVF